MWGIKIQTNNYKYRAFGVTNLCENGYQLPFFDFDITDLTLVMYELARVQHQFKLSTIYILKSTNGYNAFSLDKLTTKELNSLLLSCSVVDSLFIKFNLERGYITLRMGYDKELIGSIKSNYNEYEKSNAHKRFFNEIMNFNIFDSVNFDTGNFLRIDTYLSNKHGIDRNLLGEL